VFSAFSIFFKGLVSFNVLVHSKVVYYKSQKLCGDGDYVNFSCLKSCPCFYLYVSEYYV
jgi:hypothetical protein